MKDAHGMMLVDDFATLQKILKQTWVTRYDPNERYPEGKYSNHSTYQE